MLLAVFPANVHAARERLTIGGHQVPRLLPPLADDISRGHGHCPCGVATVTCLG
jgi:hypothetical protein